MASPKSGKACKVVTPSAPADALDADDASPGKVAEVKKEQQATKSGKYGSQKAPAYKADPAKAGWIEIELVDEEDAPVPGVPYKVTLPDNKVAEGTLDATGFARIDGIDPGTCKVSFPTLDEEAWEFIESTGPRDPEDS